MTLPLVRDKWEVGDKARYCVGRGGGAALTDGSYTFSCFFLLPTKNLSRALTESLLGRVTRESKVEVFKGGLTHTKI